MAGNGCFGGGGGGGGGGGVNAWRHGSGGGARKRVRGAARPSVGPVHMARKKKKKKRGEGGCKSLPREICAGGRKSVAIQRMGENKCLILLFSTPHFVFQSSEDLPLAFIL